MLAATRLEQSVALLRRSALRSPPPPDPASSAPQVVGLAKALGRTRHVVMVA
jgi:hypothetical protein